MTVLHSTPPLHHTVQVTRPPDFASFFVEFQRLYGSSIPLMDGSCSCRKTIFHISFSKPVHYFNCPTPLSEPMIHIFPRGPLYGYYKRKVVNTNLILFICKIFQRMLMSTPSGHYGFCTNLFTTIYP